MKNKEKKLIEKWISFAELSILFIILIVLLLKLHLIFILNIDIDEFTFLSPIYQYQRGNLSHPLFNLHVHFFSWLPLTSENEVNQIIFARIFMYIIGLGSCTFIYFIGKMFFNRLGALFSVLGYLSISNVVVHGASFRFDPLCVFFLMMSLYFSLNKSRSLRTPIFSGLSMAVSLMISLKTVFYLPTVGLIYLSKLIFENGRILTLKKMVVFLFALISGFFFIYKVHSFTLAQERMQSSFSIINKISPLNIIFNNLISEPYYLLKIFFDNFFVWLVWMAGLVIVIYYLISNKNNKRSNYFLMLTFLVPLLSLLSYKFSFPYFYVFIIPLSVLFTGVTLNKFVDNLKSNGSKVLLLSIFSLILIFFLNFITHYKIYAFDQTVSQKEIVSVVHKIFAEPVPYIDRCSMVSSFPNVGLQMTSWDMEKYAAANKPIMREILLNRKPVFILANIVHLDLSLQRGQPGIYKINPLLNEDFTILKENFIHHWGTIYVAGKQFHFNLQKENQNFEILIPGIYTLEADGNVIINEEIYEPGAKILLKRKIYTIEPMKIPMAVSLRWGADLYKPSFKPSDQPLFLGYYLQALKFRSN